MRLKTTAAAPDPRHLRWLGKWGDSTEFLTLDLFGDPAFESAAAARAAWPLCRRAVWGNHHRFRTPEAAELIDAITFLSVGTVRSGWYQDDFPLAAALEALADDRQNVAAFRARDPEGASTVADYLALLEGDFQMVETTARALAADRAGVSKAVSTAFRLRDDLQR